MEKLTLEWILKDKANCYGNETYFSYKADLAIKKDALVSIKKQDSNKIKIIQKLITTPEIVVKETKYKKADEAMRAMYEIKEHPMRGNDSYILMIARLNSLKPIKVFFYEPYYRFICNHTIPKYITLGNKNMGIDYVLNFFNKKKEFIACLAPVRIADFIGIQDIGYGI